MRHAVRAALPALVVVGILLSSSLVLGAPLGRSTPGPHRGPATTVATSPVSSRRSVPIERPSPGGPLTVAEIHRDLAGRGVPAGAVHLPALLAEGSRQGSPVAPTFSSAPAPMGVADIGLRAVGGNLVGYQLTTPSAEGTATLTDAQSVYLDGAGPDTFGLQLNSVLTNVTLFGNSTYEFWAQEFVSYTPSSGALSFGDNLWNFSSLSGEISPNALYAHGPNGSLVAPVFYYAAGPTVAIRYPFVVTFYLNTTELDDRPAVYFNFTVSNASFRASGSFDHVVFNSSVGAPGSPAAAALFQIDGNAYDPVGLINDIELAVLGNGNGATTTFFEINATLSIGYWNATAAAYLPVPSAVNAAADTGETSDGVASYYTGGAPVAHLGAGPSFLTGLWNSTTAPGIRTVVSTVTPAAAMLLVNPGTSRNASAAQWVPSSPAGTTTFFVPNTGPIFLDYLLSDYVPGAAVLGPVSPNGSFSVAESLARNTSLGIYTPLIAWGNGELSTFAASGAGTAADPFVLYHHEPGSLAPEFAQLNDLQYPVFPGLLLIATTAYVVVTPAPFLVLTPGNGPSSPPSSAPPLPATNDLQIEFWNVSHVVVSNGTITGWLAARAAAYVPIGEVIFWSSTDDLVARNTFADQGSALALYGGSSNTIWGNTFVASPVATTAPGALLGQPSQQTGIWEAESGDLVYNNNLSVSVPAYTPGFDPLSCRVTCAPSAYLDQWNISKEGATASRTDLGFVLTGSIIGTSYQGGNYWSNYGTPSNPYGVLPYVDRSPGTVPPHPGRIALGGDFVPLVPFSLYTVSFLAEGLPPGTSWSVATPLANLTSNGTTAELEAPNGTYPITVTWPTSFSPPYVLLGPSGFVVAGAGFTVDLFFVPEANVTFTETGLAPGTWWTLGINGTPSPFPAVSTPNASVSVLLGPGYYTFTVASAGYLARPASGSFVISNGSAEEVGIAFTGEPVPLWLDFLDPTCAQVSVDGGAASVRTCGTYRTLVTPGTAHLVAVTAPGFFPYDLNVTLFAGAPSYPINISMTPRPAPSGSAPIGPVGTIVIAILAALVVLLLAVTAFLYRRRRRVGPPPLVPVPMPPSVISVTSDSRREEGYEETPTEPTRTNPR